MKLGFSLHREASDELTSAILFYKDNASIETAAEFLGLVDSAIDFLREHPESSPLVSPHIRRKTIRKFPFSIFYYVSGSEIRFDRYCSP
ncbi:MAG: type II toxin-antitoxin system RelE/ParE family toxin [Chloracidobacterium sp.]|nr:type II toxin-antitoxin system RelE/ParE family toxin [Chloracidobacterium sp.]